MTATLDEMERRVIALEKAQNDNTASLKWVVGTLGQVQATVDDHTGRLGQLQATVDDHTVRLGRLETEVKAVRTEVEALRRVFDSTDFLARLRVALRAVVRAFPDLATARITVSR